MSQEDPILIEDDSPVRLVKRAKLSRAPNARVASSHSWVFTTNNPLPEWIHMLHQCVDTYGGIVKYIIFQGETAPATGTPHLQGFLQTHRKMSLKQVKDALGDAVGHLIASVDVKAAIKYCQKDDSYNPLVCPRYERGTHHPFAGTRLGFELMVEMARTGHDINSIFLDPQTAGSAVRYPGGLKAMSFAYTSSLRRRKPVQCWIFYGASGSGKSFAARLCLQAEVPPRVDGGGMEAGPRMGTSYWEAPASGGSVCDMRGYNGQECVLFDDFEPKRLPFDSFKCLTDEDYTGDVIVPYGQVKWLARHIIFTTNVHPSNWYAQDTVHTRQSIFRRFTRIVHWEGDHLMGTSRQIEIPARSIDQPTPPFWWTHFDHWLIQNNL